MEALTIGRSPDNSLVIDDPQVSRYHARLYNSGGKWYIADLNSTHGTSVNGKKVEGPVSLKPSDTILVSDVKLYFDGRSILSAKGKQLLSLTAANRPAATLPGQVAKQAVRKPAGRVSAPPKRSSVPLFAGLGVIFILFIAIILVAGGAKQEGPQLTQVLSSQQRQAVIKRATIPYDGGEYTGWLKDGLPHGQGTLKYPGVSRSGAFVYLHVNREAKDKVYVGEWQNGLKHGYGKMTYPDGRIEEGLWSYGQYVGQSGN